MNSDHKSLDTDHHHQSDESEHNKDSENDEDDKSLEDEFNIVNESEIRQHPSYVQVVLDVNRCAGRLEHLKEAYVHRTDDYNEPPEDLSEEFYHRDEDSEILAQDLGDELDGQTSHRESMKKSRLYEDLRNQRKLKKQLATLIVRLLINKENLHYYQGFHDVCLTYMTLLGHDEAYNKMDKLISSHFNKFMQPTMNETQEFLSLIPIIIGLQDQKVLDFLEQSEVGVIFALSWVITWFSHVIQKQRDVEKIFKFLEDKDPHLVLYLSAAIVLHKRDKLLELEPEMSTVHHYLCQIPRKENLRIDELLEKSMHLFDRWPPKTVIMKLDDYRRRKLQIQNVNLIHNFALKIGPAIASVVTSNTRTAIVVLVLASALALRLDKWI